MIPKVIHYCWFGGNPKPEIVKKCIASWEKFCPEWEIKEWNENNFDVMSVAYMKEAYEHKKWAFVSDVARLSIIYQHGGVYLDTDVELLDNIETWLDNKAFFVFENMRSVASGLGFGAVQNHVSIKKMLEYYDGKHFIINGKEQLFPCPAGNTQALREQYQEFRCNGQTQRFGDIIVLSPHDYELRAVHHGTALWIDGNKAEKKVYKNTKLKRFFRDYRKFEFIEKYFGERVHRIYTFIAYDFLEYGISYYGRRILHKKMKKD